MGQTVVCKMYSASCRCRIPNMQSMRFALSWVKSVWARACWSRLRPGWLRAPPRYLPLLLYAPDKNIIISQTWAKTGERTWLLWIKGPVTFRRTGRLCRICGEFYLDRYQTAAAAGWFNVNFLFIYLFWGGGKHKRGYMTNKYCYVVHCLFYFKLKLQRPRFGPKALTSWKKLNNKRRLTST